MYRLVLAACAALVVLPAGAAAQGTLPFEEPLWGPRLRITPIVGYAPALTREETRHRAGVASFVDVDLASGGGAGLQLDVRAIDRFFVYVGGVWVRRGDTWEFSYADNTWRPVIGSDFLMARGGLAARLEEHDAELQLRRVGAGVFVGPTMIRELPRGEGRLGISHWGVNFGADAEIPVGWRRITLHAAVEDNIVWWNDTGLGGRVTARPGQGLTTVDTGMSHLWFFRAGLTFKLFD